MASAIVGLSELLEEADQVIEEASKIPTVGEMVQQMVMSFISQKLQPVISPIENLQNTISQVGPQPETWHENAEAERPKDEQGLNQPST